LFIFLNLINMDKILFTAAVLVAFLAGCSSDENSGGPSNDPDNGVVKHCLTGTTCKPLSEALTEAACFALDGAIVASCPAQSSSSDAVPASSSSMAAGVSSSSSAVTPASSSSAAAGVPSSSSVEAAESSSSAGVAYGSSQLWSFEGEWTSDKDYGVYSDTAWSSGNSGLATASLFVNTIGDSPDRFPTQELAEGFAGKGVKLVTFEGGKVLTMDMPVFAGNWFLGSFQTSITNPLESVKLGIDYAKKPLKVTGKYNYTAGTGDFLFKEGAEGLAASTEDACDIYAVFYEYDGTPLTTADDLATSEKVLAQERLAACANTDGWADFALDLSYSREPDFEAHSYRFAIVFNSSFKGGDYAGKVGSTLLVDEVTVFNE
jgi:hypothetical protein